ncbi:hypothetical protein KJ780_01435, partial [Candidatus Micrarchaeota archaeon]|nr:hypothetical protein [Candidatus Micrarchaeota archaeon]
MWIQEGIFMHASLTPKRPFNRTPSLTASLSLPEPIAKTVRKSSAVPLPKKEMEKLLEYVATIQQVTRTQRDKLLSDLDLTNFCEQDKEKIFFVFLQSYFGRQNSKSINSFISVFLQASRERTSSIKNLAEFEKFWVEESKFKTFNRVCDLVIVLKDAELIISSVAQIFVNHMHSTSFAKIDQTISNLLSLNEEPKTIARLILHYINLFSALNNVIQIEKASDAINKTIVYIQTPSTIRRVSKGLKTLSDSEHFEAACETVSKVAIWMRNGKALIKTIGTLVILKDSEYLLQACKQISETAFIMQ